MKLTAPLLLLTYFLSGSWQQNTIWSSSFWRKPFDPAKKLLSALESTPLQEPNGKYLNFSPKHLDANNQSDRSLLSGRTSNQKNWAVKNTDQRAFGLGSLLGINYIANLILNSLTNAITSTTFVTSTSTVTAATIVTCYHTSLFATSTVACRRKRNTGSTYPDLLAGDNIPENFEGNDAINLTTIETLPKQAISHIDLISRLLVSSINEEPTSRASSSARKQSESSINRYLQKNRQGQQRSISLVTSTITTYSLYVISSTKTISTTFAANGVLSCVPSGFTLCPAAGR